VEPNTDHLKGLYTLSPLTAIAANLPASAAMMGNVVVWKPSDSQIFSAQIIEVFKEAGVPDGVINVVLEPGMITDTVLASRDFAGIHFTGSTHVFKDIWAKIGANIHHYKTYPRIVGETGGILLSLTQVLNKYLQELFVVLLSSKDKNVQQLHELMYHKVCGQL
jgi:delta 1-pyrroline-5-carboxylate dehydrogenase